MLQCPRPSVLLAVASAVRPASFVCRLVKMWVLAGGLLLAVMELLPWLVGRGPDVEEECYWTVAGRMLVAVSCVRMGEDCSRLVALLGSQ